MILRSLLILVASATLLSAQDKGKLQVRFLAERTPRDLGQVVLAAGEAKSAAFDLPVNHLSGPVVAPGRVFQVRSAKADPAKAEGVLSTVTLPEQGDSFIGVPIPNPRAATAPSSFPRTTRHSRGATFTSITSPPRKSSAMWDR